MRLLLGFLPAVACIGAMVLCMRMMSGSRDRTRATHGEGANQGGAAGSDREIADLRDEVNRLRAELRHPEEDPSRPVTP